MSDVQNASAAAMAAFDEATGGGPVTLNEAKIPGDLKGFNAKYRRFDTASEIIEKDKTTKTPRLSTGVYELDKALRGGLPIGVTIIPGMPSAGKSALAVNIADYNARQGSFSLYVSNEMTPRELLHRSISRETAQYARESGELTTAVTYSTLAEGAWLETMKAKLTPACTIKVYSTLCNTIDRYLESTCRNVYVAYCPGWSVEEVSALVDRFADLVGKAPVVFVDYLQKLAPRPGETDKQTADRNSRVLKQMSADLETPVIAVSSINRESYSGSQPKKTLAMTSLKESGNLEFDADCILGVQYWAQSHSAEEVLSQINPKAKPVKAFDLDAEKRKNPREVEFCVLKYRNNPLSNSSRCRFYAGFNLFDDSGSDNAYRFLTEYYDAAGDLLKKHQ